MKNLLLETGMGENIVCPYCGYNEAESETESRADLTPENFQYEGGYMSLKWCPLCGYSKYENYKGYDEEAQDPYLETKPDDASISTSEKIQKMLNSIEPSKDEVHDTLSETSVISFEPGKDDVNGFMHKSIAVVFEEMYG